METPSQASIVCKGCGQTAVPHKTRRIFCIPCARRMCAAHSKAWRARKGQVYRDRMRARRGAVLSRLDEAGKAAFRKAECEKAARLWRKLREEVFAAYGGKRCSCCGESEPLFLTIDHVSNNGAEMRKNGTHGRSGTAFYQWLRKSGFPSGFQVLCMNCNHGKHRNGGKCPHKSKKV